MANATVPVRFSQPTAAYRSLPSKPENWDQSLGDTKGLQKECLHFHGTPATLVTPYPVPPPKTLHAQAAVEGWTFPRSAFSRGQLATWSGLANGFYMALPWFTSSSTSKSTNSEMSFFDQSPCRAPSKEHKSLKLLQFLGGKTWKNWEKHSARSHWSPLITLLRPERAQLHEAPFWTVDLGGFGHVGSGFPTAPAVFDGRNPTQEKNLSKHMEWLGFLGYFFPAWCQAQDLKHMKVNESFHRHCRN